MVAKNDITGDSIQSKASSKAYADNYDRIFGNKPKYELDVGPLTKDHHEQIKSLVPEIPDENVTHKLF